MLNRGLPADALISKMLVSVPLGLEQGLSIWFYISHQNRLCGAADSKRAKSQRQRGRLRKYLHNKLAAVLRFALRLGGWATKRYYLHPYHP